MDLSAQWGSLERATRVAQVYAGDTAAHSRSIAVVAVTDDYVEVEGVAGEGDANGVCLVHGGVVFHLADTATGLAANSVGEGAFVTSSASITFVSPGRVGETLRARCVGPVAAAGRTAVFTATVSRTTGEQVAVLTSTMRSLRRR